MTLQHTDNPDSSATNAEFNLFCLPSAGSSAAMYYAWKQLVPDSLNVIPIEYPGHGAKVAEALVNQPDKLAQEIAQTILNTPLKPFILFGHSMGAALLWHVEGYLKKSQHYHNLKLMIVSGRPEHSHIRDMPHKHTLSRDALKEQLKRYNGTYQEILDNDEILDFFLVILRNDFHLSDIMLADIVEKTSVPLVAFYGKDDPDIPQQNMMDSWALHSTQWLGSHAFKGDHFYFNNTETLIKLLEKIQSLLQPNPA